MGVSSRLQIALAMWLGVVVVAISAVSTQRVQAQAAAVPSLSTSAPGLPVAEGLIQVDVTVTDASGKLVTGLQAKDFTLLENNQPNKIVSFQAMGENSPNPVAPIEVILLIDVVNLSAGQASVEEHEVEKFLRQNDGHLAQPTSVFWVSTSGIWGPARPQPSTDGNALAASLEHKGGLRAVLGGQAASSQSSLVQNSLPLRAVGSIAAAARQKSGRKLLFWIGPHLALGSGGSFQGADRQHLFNAIVWFSTLLREARVTLYTLSAEQTEEGPLHYSSDPIDTSETGEHTAPYQGYLTGVKESRQAVFADLDRKVLAVQSGGRALSHRNNLAGEIQHCIAEARAWYTLSFNPQSAGRPDEYHDLQAIVGRPGLTARTSTGYYDQPYYRDQPNVTVRRVTVEQLGQMMAAARNTSDGEMARQLSELELTERVSSGQLESRAAGLRGAKSRQALVALADASAFLDPPAAEILTDAAPDLATQRQMLLRTVGYLTKIIPKLPNFFATRTTVLYEETTAHYDQAGEPGTGYQALHVSGSMKDRMIVRDGKEVADPVAAKHKKQAAEQSYFRTYGTFGPILGTVMLDTAASPSGFLWQRWERSAAGPVAVFRYVVPAEKSHYDVASCCLPDGDGTTAFRKLAGYHGEITIDPANGTILRLVVQADLKTAVPLARSDIMVEYGPVKIGSNVYLCPVRSVSLMRGRTLKVMQGWDGGFKTYGPFVTTLNDVVFGDYHAFSAVSRVLPGFDPGP